MKTTEQTNNSILIVGLGNPGPEYQKTRHNVGFEALNFLTKKSELAKFKNQKKFKADVSINKINNQKIILAKPQTFMNNSGEAISALKNFYQIDNKKITIIYDELDLPFGQIRVRSEGSSAGHNGIKSIISCLGTDKFNRIRIGIKNELVEQIETADFVLSKFSKDEKKILEKTIWPMVLIEIEKIIHFA